MHEFKQTYQPVGGCFLCFAAFFGLMAYLANRGFLVVTISVGIFLLIALPFFLYRNRTTFSDATRSVTHVNGFLPWLKTRQIIYQDIENLILDGRTSSGKSRSAQYEFKLAIRGNPKPLVFASYDEAQMRRQEPIALALAATTDIPLVKTEGYLKTRDKFDSTHEQRHFYSKITLGFCLLFLLVAGYFALAHFGYPVPFQAAIEDMFQQGTSKGNLGKSVASISLVLGVALGMIGIANYFQSR